ncbi:KpsF/GutQ family sugar-phosphate isomerase [Candidatus Bealeia paramacronuclearis]
MSVSSLKIVPKTTKSLEEARRVLTLEANSLESLANHLDHSFTETIEILNRIQGRVIVTGIGKSGHIANKIAATLSSTGTPSFFIHPTEASHGDLGMLSKEDAIMILSSSGETQELLDIIGFAKRFGIPLIGITGSAESTLGKASNVVLTLPPYQEACPHQLAPTTSTTLMLALGDALAVALLQEKGFSALDFKNLHPGGKLGARLSLVSDLMRDQTDLPLSSLKTPMSEALIQMTQKGFGCLGIIDQDKKLCGIITDGDLRRHMSPTLLNMTAEEVMTPSPLTISKEAWAQEALHIMNEKSITSLFVIAENRTPLGLIRLHDCLKAGLS